jgi:hypothetical protein
LFGKPFLVLQLGGFSFPNVVAVLLLPVFILPGYAGLKIRQYVARRTDDYDRLDTVAYSWIISTLSVAILYAIVFLFTNDLTLIPDIVRVEPVTSSEPTQLPPGSETGLRLERLAFGYACHFVLSSVIGALYGAFAYNFLDEVRITAGDSNRELLFDHIAPGKRVDVRTKSGELFRGKAGIKRDTADEAGILLRSPTRLVDNDAGEIVKKHPLGRYIYINAEEISRISITDQEDPENLDPEATYDKPDRLQSFITTLVGGLWPDKVVAALRTQPRQFGRSTVATVGPFILIGVTLAVLEWRIMVPPGFSMNLSFTFLLAVLWIAFLLVTSAGFLSLSLEKVPPWQPTVGFTLSALYSGTWLFFSNSLIEGYLGATAVLTAGLLIGSVGVYATTLKRARSGVYSVITLLGIALVSDPVTVPKILSQAPVQQGILLIISTLMFYEVIQGGPSRRISWAKKIQPPIIIGITAACALSLLHIPAYVSRENPTFLYFILPLALGIWFVYHQYRKAMSF